MKRTPIGAGGRGGIIISGIIYYFLKYILFFQARTVGHEPIPAQREDSQGEESEGGGQKVQGVEGGARTAISLIKLTLKFSEKKKNQFRGE
jgi:hypothetical protein